MENSESKDLEQTAQAEEVPAEETVQERQKTHSRKNPLPKQPRNSRTLTKSSRRSWHR